MKQKTEEKLPNYGGQALIEGVLMRGRDHVVGAFRSPQGEIILESEELEGIYKSKIANLPFFRGLVILWDSLSLGWSFIFYCSHFYRSINRHILCSANING